MNVNSVNHKYKKKAGSNASPRSEEAEVKTVNYEKHSGYVGSAHRTRCHDEAYIEVEMNDSVRNIVYSPQRGRSALLDVSFIKPKENSEVCVERNTLNALQVRELLSNIEKQKREKKSFIMKLLENEAISGDTIVKISTHKPLEKRVVSEGSQHKFPKRKKPSGHTAGAKTKVTSASAPINRHFNCLTGFRDAVDPLFLDLRESLRNVEARITAIQENIDCDCDESPYPKQQKLNAHMMKCGDQNPQVFRTVPKTPKDLKGPYCKTKADKMPCTCTHCGTMGLLSESQKYPIVAHTPEPKELFRKGGQYSNKHSSRQRPASPNTNGDYYQERYMYYLNDLAERVKILEERLEFQEERAVPKDYFKRIITKIVSHFSAKTDNPSMMEPNITAKSESAKATNVSTSTTPLQQRYKSQISNWQVSHDQKFYPNSQYVNTVLVESQSPFDRDKSMAKPVEKQAEAKGHPSEGMKRSPTASETFWKWGGEILKPGVDLKNKIISLLELTFSKFASTTSELRVGKEPRMDERYGDGGGVQYGFDAEVQGGYATGHAQNYRRTAGPHGKYENFERLVREARAAVAPVKLAADGNKNVNIQYVNPNLAAWKEESSCASVKADYSEESDKRHTDESTNTAKRNEFLKVLDKTKDIDKERLWQSIWNQAQLNGQTKNDRVTIQIPKQPRPGENVGDLIEIDFTIEELESILTKRM